MFPSAANLSDLSSSSSREGYFLLLTRSMVLSSSSSSLRKSSRVLTLTSTERSWSSFFPPYAFTSSQAVK